MATSLNTIRTLTIRSKTEGVQAAAAQIADLAQENDGAAGTRRASRQLSMAESLERLEHRFISGVRGQR